MARRRTDSPAAGNRRSAAGNRRWAVGNRRSAGGPAAGRQRPTAGTPAARRPPTAECRPPTAGAPADRRPPIAEGWEGWDDYAPFYDWENARTLGRRDVPFWRQLALDARGPVLELGCGTGRVSLPLARAGVAVVGIDRSDRMLARARRRVRRARLARRVRLVRGDIRRLPFGDSFPAVIAPYGILQSLLRERDLEAALSAVHEALEPGGVFGLELVADLPAWEEYRKRVSLKGWRRTRGGSHVTLVETVRQDARRKLTIFDQEFTERRGRERRIRRFSLTFRTLSVPQMTRRLERAGFEVTALLGDYRGGPWDPRAEAWVILARKPGGPGRDGAA